jgi:hypothetical protein
LNLALTSDFPSTAANEIAARIRVSAPKPRVAWIPPSTRAGCHRFARAQAQFQGVGISAVEVCDIDEEPNREQLAHLRTRDPFRVARSGAAHFAQGHFPRPRSILRLS